MSFDSAEVRFAQDDRHFVGANFRIGPLIAEPGDGAGDGMVRGRESYVGRGGLAGGEQGGPPAGADAEIADSEKGSGGDNEKQGDCSRPAQAEFHGVAAEHAGFADVGGEGGPAAVVVDELAGGAVGFEESLSPVMLVEAESAGVAADDSLGEDAAGKQAKALLLQSHEVVLADFCDGRDFFQRYAAGEPLHAQVFAKVAHLDYLKTSNVPKRVTYPKVSSYHNKPGHGSRQSK